MCDDDCVPLLVHKELTLNNSIHNNGNTQKRRQQKQKEKKQK